MSGAPFRIVPLHAAAHDRSRFTSGSAPLDRYLREQVMQDIRRRVAACFVALTYEQRIAGYYTLGSASLLLADLPVNTAKKLPRYPTVHCPHGASCRGPGAQGTGGLGGALPANALHRSARSRIAAYALMVDAEGDSAMAFYRWYGFIALPHLPRTLFLPLPTVR